MNIWLWWISLTNNMDSSTITYEILCSSRSRWTRSPFDRYEEEKFTIHSTNDMCTLRQLQKSFFSRNSYLCSLVWCPAFSIETTKRLREHNSDRRLLEFFNTKLDGLLNLAPSNCGQYRQMRCQGQSQAQSMWKRNPIVGPNREGEGNRYSSY